MDDVIDATNNTNPALLYQSRYSFTSTNKLLWKLPLQLKKRITSNPFSQTGIAFTPGGHSMVDEQFVINPVEEGGHNRLVRLLQHHTILPLQDG
jgi:hypothetical protein